MKESAVVMCSTVRWRIVASIGFLESVEISEAPVSPTPPQATVVISPAGYPELFSIFQIMKQVVVLPLVPVTPMT